MLYRHRLSTRDHVAKSAIASERYAYILAHRASSLTTIIISWCEYIEKVTSERESDDTIACLLQDQLVSDMGQDERTQLFRIS